MPQPLEQLPKSVLERGLTTRLVNGTVPALLVHPHWDAAAQRATRTAPVLIWMHGRTVNKELDPGRYLNLARAGIASCAVDLPGHGERADPALQAATSTLRVVAHMVSEIDAIVADLQATGYFTGQRLALGGMSAGGMAALVRLTRPHPFSAALVESTSGNWRYQRHREMFDAELAQAMDPIQHLQGWTDIPILGLHSQLDEWIPVVSQREFFDQLRARSAQPDSIVLHEFPQTGAPFEHSGFGRLGRTAKDLGAAFLARYLSA
jgi:alpha-beta hydrolase superfamily lysophospholipase